jgi:fucose permease
MAVAFVALGMSRASLGVAWPAAASAFDRPVSDLGWLLAGFVALYALGTMLSRRLVEAKGTGGVVTGAVALAAVGLALTATAGNWQLATVGVGLAGLGGGLIDAAVNSDVALHHGARAMGMLHASYGVGATVGPLLVTFGLARGGHWRPAFVVFAALNAVIAARFFARRQLWQDREAPAHAPPPAKSRKATIVLALLVFALITATETTAAQFGFSYLTLERHLSESIAGLAVAGFYAGLTVTRFGLGAVGHRLRPERLLTVSTVGVIAGAALLWWSVNALVAGTALAVMGLAGGALFPVNVLLTPRRVGTAATQRVVGWQLAAANVGGAVYPPVVGAVIAAVGLAAVGPAVVGLAAALALVVEALRRTSRPAAVTNTG